MATRSQPAEHIAYNAPNPGTGDSAFRSELRKERIAARTALPVAEHARLSAAVEAHLERELAALPPGRIAFCWPIRNEFDARPLVRRLLAGGWCAAMPVAAQRAAPMRFRPWTPESPMAADPYGIPVPSGDAEAPPPDVLLLPLVAFDAAGYRLGYGGGYFDRTLAALAPRPICIGVGFELARAADLRPQAHDVPLDAVATEAGIFRAAAGRRP